MTQKLYLKDSYLLETSARVLEVAKVEDGFDVLLDRTVFFPTSGGQPADRGWLDEEPLLDVRLDGERVLHRTARAPRGTVVHCRVDRATRLDHMQQHSGQHLLSRVLLDRFGTPTVSFHLGTNSSTVDLAEASGPTRAGGPLDEAALEEAEGAANELVQSSHPVRVGAPTPMELGSAPADLQSLSAGELRIVDMHGIDRSFCCGTHLRSTSEIGPIKILGLERRGPLVRVEFLCGGRSLAHHARLHRTVTQLIRQSSARMEDLPAYLDGVVQDRDARGRQVRALQGELARARADLLATRATAVGAFRLARLVQSGGAADDVRLLGEQLSAQHRCIFIGGHRPEAGDKGAVVLALPPGTGLHAGKLLGEVLARVGGRGGGRPELAQGGAPSGRIDEAVELVVGEASQRLQRPTRA